MQVDGDKENLTPSVEPPQGGINEVIDSSYKAARHRRLYIIAIIAALFLSLITAVFVNRITTEKHRQEVQSLRYENSALNEQFQNITQPQGN